MTSSSSGVGVGSVDIVGLRLYRRLGSFAAGIEHVAGTSVIQRAKPNLTCGDVSGPGWDRTSDLPRVKLRRSQNRDVCAGQSGRTGLILRVQSTRYDRRGGYRADENEPVIRRHGRTT